MTLDSMAKKHETTPTEGKYGPCGGEVLSLLFSVATFQT